MAAGQAPYHRWPRRLLPAVRAVACRLVAVGRVMTVPAQHRRVIPATCSVCQGARGFTNLLVRKVDSINGVIELDPHVTGRCVVTLDETAAEQLFEAIGQWLGLTVPVRVQRVGDQ